MKVRRCGEPNWGYPSLAASRRGSSNSDIYILSNKENELPPIWIQHRQCFARLL